ncbi:MAG: SDR family oxidoreductase [Bacillota bacterium]|nr:3-ketoacyl-ACP reductase [Bacillota bacterium]REJ35929.1 MAG: 3-ketoacyl-ACP reductase [Bacillota bacterium]
MRLAGKVAVVTGAASGMGEQIAKLFAKEGAKVVAADLNGDGAERVVQEIRAAGGTAVAVKANVAIEEDVQRMIDTAVQEFGTLDILVNNAGVMDNFEAAHEVTDQVWERVLAVNTTGPMRAMRKAIPMFLEKGKGTIINIASVGGLAGGRAGLSYTASKHALIGMTKNVAFHYATKGIRCNAICPGAVETNISASMTARPSAIGYERLSLGLPLNPRTGKPEEIAAAALFLASDEASFVNGAILVVDGGWTVY